MTAIRVAQQARGRIARLAAIVVATLTLAGCLDSPTPTPSPTPLVTPEPTPTTTTYDLGTTVYYAGLLVHVQQATATLDAGGGPLEVLLRIENPGSDPADLPGGVTFVLGDARVEPSRESRLPTVPAGSAATADLVFDLQGIASAAGGALEIGAAPKHVGLVPLTSAGGEARLFEPIALDVSGTASAGELRVRLTAGELRWDLPDWQQEEVAGLQALTLTFDVTFTGSFAGGLAFTGENIALRLPDGNVVGARRDGHSQPVELIGPGKTKKDLATRFEIPTGTTGEFALLVRNGSTEKAIPFTLGG